MAIPYVEDLSFFTRKDNVLIAVKTNGERVPLVFFKQRVIDINVIDDQVYHYMNKYMETFPELCEIIYPPKNTKEQLTLF